MLIIRSMKRQRKTKELDPKMYFGIAFVIEKPVATLIKSFKNVWSAPLEIDKRNLAR